MKPLPLLTALIFMTGCASYDSYQTKQAETASYGTAMIPASECIGAVVNGTCHGTPTPGEQIRIQTGQTPRCYGTVLNGQCIGPQF